jgi:multidrug transporter EmrE-like cation transporter
MNFLPIGVMIYLGVAGALAPVLLKLGQDMAGLSPLRLAYLAGFVFFYGTAFLGLVWVVKQAPLTLIVPVWYATLLCVAAACGLLVFGERMSGLGWLAYGLIISGLLLRLYEALR